MDVKRYSINFKLYNMANHGSILGYNLGQFFGILIELSSFENENITNSGFITFGYVDTVDKETTLFDNDFISICVIHQYNSG